MKTTKHDCILEPITIDEIILTIEANGDEPSELNVVKTFKDLMKRRHDDAIYSMQKEMVFILQELKNEKQ